MNRITDKQLQAKVDTLNELMGRPMAPYAKVGDRHVAQIGNFHLSHAYGGVTVLEMASESGGCSHACGLYGHVPKRVVADALDGAIWAARTLKAA